MFANLMILEVYKMFDLIFTICFLIVLIASGIYFYRKEIASRKANKEFFNSLRKELSITPAPINKPVKREPSKPYYNEVSIQSDPYPAALIDSHNRNLDSSSSNCYLATSPVYDDSSSSNCDSTTSSSSSDCDSSSSSSDYSSSSDCYSSSSD
jgi:hypothetical protein